MALRKAKTVAPTMDERIIHIRTLLAECSTLLDELDRALDRAEHSAAPPTPLAVHMMMASFAGT